MEGGGRRAEEEEGAAGFPRFIELVRSSHLRPFLSLVRSVGCGEDPKESAAAVMVE